jgi:hypothetical protein
MGLIDLYDGIAVVVDDEIHDSNSGIGRIVKHLKDRNIPVVKYTELPNDEAIKHLHSVSFIILDWELKPDLGLEEAEAARIRFPESLYAPENLEFIKRVREITYCPIFIFTHHDAKKIIKHLHDAEMVPDIGKHPIYVESKDDVEDAGRLFSTLERWLKEQPAAYALKMIHVETKKAETELFKKFLNINPAWPSVLWQASQDDKSEYTLDLKDFIVQYINNTIAIPEFEESIVRGDFSSHPAVAEDDLIAIYNGANYVEATSIGRKNAMTGDLFLMKEPKETYYLINIKPLCDLIRQKNPRLYCLKGKIITDSDELSLYEGQIIQKASSEVLPHIAGVKAIKFSFRDLKVEKWNRLKTHLIGQVLPPFSLHIQQRYSQYLHRIGLPRIPDGYFRPMEKCTVSASSQSIG